MREKKKILIVGGTGFIGYHLAKKALKKNWSITSISTRKPKSIRKLKKVKYIICDIANKRFLKKYFKQHFHYVVNLGGYVDHSHRQKTFRSHYLGCVNLTDILLKSPPITFVQMGSSGEYGRSKSPHRENNSKCRPTSVYGNSKLLSTRHLLNLFRKKNFPSVILRLYQAYGPRQDANRFLPYVIAACLKNKKFPCSEGKQFRDFLHVDDVVDAIISSLTKKNAKGEVINIGSGKPKKIKTIIEYLAKILKGGHPQFGKIALRKDETIKLYPSIRKAKEKIKWKPKISFERGLRETIKFYNEHYRKQ